jgi:hypothetical protein
LSNFTPPAQKLWAAIPSEHRIVILNSVWCGYCRETTNMLNIIGSVKGGDLILQGKRERWGNAIGRLVESG